MASGACRPPTNHHFLSHQVQQLPFGLGCAAADARQLDALRVPIEIGAALADADDAPSQVAEDLPPSHALGVDLSAAGCLVGGEQLLARADAAGGLVAAEAPRAP